jgi:hypothetical protein
MVTGSKEKYSLIKTDNHFGMVAKSSFIVIFVAGLKI